MTSTDRKSAARAYMAEHGINYTSALRAVGSAAVPTMSPRHMLLRYEFTSDSPIGELQKGNGPMFATFKEAKIVADQGYDRIVSGFLAPDRSGGTPEWHNTPYGIWLERDGGLFGSRSLDDKWNSISHPAEWWTPKWFTKFPTPASAAMAPGTTNGDLVHEFAFYGFRFVTPDGSLVTRLLPGLSEEAALIRFSSGRQQRRHRDEMFLITKTFDPELGIQLKEERTEYGLVQYWEFETPKLQSFISWSSVDRYQKARADAVRDWVQRSDAYSETLSELDLNQLDRCDLCDEVVTLSHPLVEGAISSKPYRSKSAALIRTPVARRRSRMTWSDLLLLHIFGGYELADHARCNEKKEKPSY